jgi:hypothetical protein
VDEHGRTARRQQLAAQFHSDPHQIFFTAAVEQRELVCKVDAERARDVRASAEPRATRR